jgi:hypothetical protein
LQEYDLQKMQIPRCVAFHEEILSTLVTGLWRHTGTANEERTGDFANLPKDIRGLPNPK